MNIAEDAIKWGRENGYITGNTDLVLKMIYEQLEGNISHTTSKNRKTMDIIIRCSVTIGEDTSTFYGKVGTCKTRTGGITRAKKEISQFLNNSK